MKYGNRTLGQVEAVFNKLGGDDGVERFLKGELKVVEDKLLELQCTVTISATKKKFVAKDRFVVNTSKKAPVKISYLGDNFKEWFLKKTEEPIGETELQYSRLKRASVDGPIIAELGGEGKAEVTLIEMFSLMEMQPNGENGALLNNGYANIFYVHDISGVLRAVSVGWDVDGWYVDADSVEYPFGWNGDSRVFSRNSCVSET